MTEETMREIVQMAVQQVLAKLEQQHHEKVYRARVKDASKELYSAIDWLDEPTDILEAVKHVARDHRVDESDVLDRALRMADLTAAHWARRTRKLANAKAHTAGAVETETEAEIAETAEIAEDDEDAAIPF